MDDIDGPNLLAKAELRSTLRAQYDSDSQVQSSRHALSDRDARIASLQQRLSAANARADVAERAAALWESKTAAAERDARETGALRSQLRAAQQEIRDARDALTCIEEQRSSESYGESCLTCHRLGEALAATQTRASTIEGLLREAHGALGEVLSMRAQIGSLQEALQSAEQWISLYATNSRRGRYGSLDFSQLDETRGAIDDGVNTGGDTSGLLARFRMLAAERDTLASERDSLASLLQVQREAHEARLIELDEQVAHLVREQPVVEATFQALAQENASLKAAVNMLTLRLQTIPGRGPVPP